MTYPIKAIKRGVWHWNRFNLVPWVVFFPLIGLLINLLFGKRLSEKAIGHRRQPGYRAVLCGGRAAGDWPGKPSRRRRVFTGPIGSIGDFEVGWAFRVDTLSVVMMLVVSGVGTSFTFIRSATCTAMCAITATPDASAVSSSILTCSSPP
jgi:hypothetical protein